MSSNKNANVILTASRLTVDDENGYKGTKNPVFTPDIENGSTRAKTPVDDAQEKESLTKTTPGILAGLQYKVDDSPPILTTFLLGFQHYLMLLSSNLATPGIFATIMCAQGDKHVTSLFMGTMLFACGLGTLIQTFIGTRLPIVQCPAFAYVVPMLAMIDLDEWRCPEIALNETLAGVNGTVSREYWKTRLNLLAGSGMVAATFEVLIGASGIISLLLRFIGPLTVAPTIMMIGLGVTKLGFDMAGKHWGISLPTLALVVILSECIPKFSIKLPCGKKGPNGERQKIDFVFHKMFSVTLSVGIMWLLCYIFTITDVFPTDKSVYGHEARTDLRSEFLHEVPWFEFPYPGKWGTPTFSSAMFVGMIAGVLTSIIESIGDYYTCARIAGALPPPPSTVNRGILIEGVDCILSVLIGGGFGVTSCSQNIGVISLSKVGSRRVVLMAGFLMMVFGCVSKLSAFVVSIPDPIVGAAFIILFAVLTAVGASNLQYVDLNSPRNMVVFGSSLFVGLALPPWLASNQVLLRSIDSGPKQVIQALLGNNIFMACFTALILDNVMPGTDAERGIISWRTVLEEDTASGMPSGLSLKTYDLPFGMEYIRKWKWTRYIPFSPTFIGIDFITRKCCCNKDEKLYERKTSKDGEDSEDRPQQDVFSMANIQ